MAIGLYLAMTGAEFSVCTQLPKHIGWLACHFSASGPGISNIPKTLPPDSLLILDDSNPFHSHQPEQILHQLQEAAEDLAVGAVILDFQRPQDAQTAALAALLQKKLICPVAAPPDYAAENAPVFLPPCPLYRPLAVHLAPYRGRQIWLDASPRPMVLTVTESGCALQLLFGGTVPRTPHPAPHLHCSYGISVAEQQAVFTFQRSEAEFDQWLQEADALSVCAVIGLYQEFRQ